MAVVASPILNPCFDIYTREMASQARCERVSNDRSWVAALAITAVSAAQLVDCWNDYGDNIDDRDRVLDKIIDCANSENTQFCDNTMVTMPAASELACTIDDADPTCDNYEEKSKSISTAIDAFIARQSGCVPCDTECDSELSSAVACSTVNNSAHRYRATQRRNERRRALKSSALASVNHSARNVATIGKGAYSQSMQIHQSLQNIYMSCLRDNIAGVGYGLGGLIRSTSGQVT